VTANLLFYDERKVVIFAFKIVHDDACHPIQYNYSEFKSKIALSKMLLLLAARR